MKIIKFGGKSLANGKGLNQTIKIIDQKLRQKEKLVVTLSARGNATDELEHLLDLALEKKDYYLKLEKFKEYQLEPLESIDFNEEFELIDEILHGVKLVQDYSLKTKDLFLAQGEILSAKIVSGLLNLNGATTFPVDSRDLFVTDNNYGSAKVLDKLSKKKTTEFFNQIPVNKIPIVTGFIAKSEENCTSTLGRNGSNYSASLLAKYLAAQTVLSYTHVSGIFTANPDSVSDAKIITQLSYKEANELASFGASILHTRTISPLIEQKIPLRILNTFNPDHEGTLISHENSKKEVKSISVQENVEVINLEGRGILGRSGIDARIFSVLQKEDISIGLISQGASERGVGFVVQSKHAKKAIKVLESEFKYDIKIGDVNAIYAIDNVSVITIVGQTLNGFSSAYQSLVKNNVEVLLINNTLSGSNISLVIKNDVANKAVNLIHAQIFGVSKKVNIAIFGKGTVGGVLIDQILENESQILERKGTKLNIFALSNSRKILLDKNGIDSEWITDFDNKSIDKKDVFQVIDYANAHHLENLIIIDNTADAKFVENYPTFIENGFDLISSNKIANTIDFSFYKSLREGLKKHHKTYLYETNVGAGLPLIDTIKLLHDSGENITRIKGVFSGSLSYLFNAFSKGKQPFSSALQSAIDLGLTEPDPREDLSGQDVARKLLILARELDLENEFSDIQIQNLIPESLIKLDQSTFLNKLSDLDETYDALRKGLKKGEVLRYVGDLHGDLQQSKGLLDVKLESVSEFSALGQLSGSDSLFEIYTDSYGDRPIIIQGAGAGAAVTARGVFGDLLRIADKK